MDQGPVQLVDVREGLNDTVVMLNSKLRDGIKVTLAYSDGVPRIQGFGSELNQVWTHVIDNAMAAMGDKGGLELKAYQEDEWVVVQITDNGPGIPPEAKGRSKSVLHHQAPRGGYGPGAQYQPWHRRREAPGGDLGRVAPR